MKKRSSLLTVVESPRRWFPMMDPLLTMVVLLLVMMVTPLLLIIPNLPTELSAAMLVPLGKIVV